MAQDVATLPRDPDVLIDIIVDQQEEIERLLAMIATLTRAVYGPRSERFTEAELQQMDLELGDLSGIPVEPQAKPEAKPLHDRRPRRPARRNIGSLPIHLPREDIVLEPDATECPCCRGALHKIGEDLSEMLDHVPAVLRVKRFHRPRYGCRVCESVVAQAPAPERPVANGLPTTALLAHVAVSKFAWHIPLHRQTKMLASSGITIDRSTLVHWIERAAWWLRPLHALLAETVLSSPKVFCDDTPLPVLDRSRTRTRIGRLWCYAVDDRPWQGSTPPAVVYLFAEDRRGQHVSKHLDGFTGVLQVDAYAGYDALTRPGRQAGPITLAYCLAHARRRFFDLHKGGNQPVATEAVRRIADIYEIEAGIRGKEPEMRKAVRQRETKPLMVELKSWLMARLEEISVKSKLAESIRYTLGHWDGLTLFLDDGRVEVDSNAVERQIRAIALGRRNALFAGSAAGGERWAILSSLINCAKLHDIDPQAYLADVLERIVTGATKVNALAELLPWNWKAARQTATAPA
ncbi:MAG TPA: IS66 family transposase [Acetobacteraceae bacterium]|nr:IS66 family transposase [Acetobacteraceae bacterium]